MHNLSLYSGMMAQSIKIVACLVTIFLSLPVFSQTGPSPLALYEEGRAVADKNPSKAYYIFIRSIALARKNGDWDVYIEALNSSSNLVLAALSSLSDPPPPLARKNDEAFNSAREALPLTENFKSRPAVALLHYNVAEFYSLNNDVDTAVYHYQKAKDIFASLNGESSREVAQCYHGLGDVYKYNKLDFYDAEINYEKALTIREGIGFQDTLVLYKNFYSLAATNKSQLDFEKALSYGTKAMDLAKALDPLRVELTTAMVANIYRDMKESAMATKYYLEAISLNKRTNIEENRAYYYMSLGETYKNDSSYREALRCFNEAYPYFRSSEGTDRNLFLYLLLHRADVYSTLKQDANFIEATREYFRELSLRNQPQGTFASLGMALLGDYHRKKNGYDSALSYYQKALNSLLPTFTSTNTKDNPTEGMEGFF
ncbi:MAG TPA: tetratricopeptide repeat protein, partial [Chryseolinea sp.]